MDAPQTDPLAVVNAMTAAVSRQDSDAALTYFADAAVVHLPGQDTPTYTGKDEIRTWLTRDAGSHTQVQVDQARVVGDRVTGTAIVVDDTVRQLGLTHIAGPTEVVVQHGHITSLTFTLDDASLAKLNTAG
ncbi:MAG: nuclear transport factor 2 family protein [Chloroflexota bacterium]|nr:nuclear transport factor 2 family protein [Chloroflexota bacterium]